MLSEATTPKPLARWGYGGKNDMACAAVDVLVLSCFTAYRERSEQSMNKTRRKTRGRAGIWDGAFSPKIAIVDLPWRYFLGVVFCTIAAPLISKWTLLE